MWEVQWSLDLEETRWRTCGSGRAGTGPPLGPDRMTRHLSGRQQPNGERASVMRQSVQHGLAMVLRKSLNRDTVLPPPPKAR